MSDETNVRRQRRERLMAACGTGLVLVRGATAGSKVNPNFYYLTGLDAPAGALLLASRGMRIGVGRAHPGPDYVRGRMVRQVLLLPPGDPLAARWGEAGPHTAGSVQAAEAGVDAVLSAGALEPLLDRLLPEAGTLHYVRGGAPTLGGADDTDTEFVGRVRRRFFGVCVEDATPAVHELRRIKDASEIAAIERAARATARALEAACALLRPGLHEHEVEAELIRAYRAAGATHAFEPIVAAGPNALRLHYRENDAEIAHGQLVLVDTGASLAGYASDVTRTVPADGTFNGRQRVVYEAVLEAQREAIEACRPGALLADVHERAWRSIDRAGFGAHFVHGTSHHIGLETHDPGDVHRPLVAGCVITVEPGIYLEDEGLGVRIEDDVLVTDAGPRVLTEDIPRSVEAIERLLARAGA